LDASVSLTDGILPDEFMGDGFDITVSDGAHSIKAMLAVSLNRLVYSGQLAAPCVIRVEKWTRIFNEHVLGGAPYVLLHSLSVVPLVSKEQQQQQRSEKETESGDAAEAQPITHPWLPQFLGADRLNRPLCLCRNYYLPLWNDDFPSMISAAGGTEKEEERPAVLPALPETMPAKGARLPLLADVMRVTHVRSKKSQKTDIETNMVVGIVTKKSRLIHYGGIRDLHKPQPFQCQLTLTDDSQSVIVTLWNQCAVNWHPLIQVGKPVLITGGRIQPSYSNPGSKEISVNPSNPRGVVHAIVEEHPLVQANCLSCLGGVYQFIGTKDCALLPDRTTFDLAGVILEAGRPEREQIERSSRFAEYRWITLTSSLQDPPISIKVYVNSQIAKFMLLAPGKVVVLTGVMSASVTTHSKNPRSLYLKTTPQSEILFDFAHLSSIPLVREVLETLQGQGAIEPLRKQLSMQSRHGPHRQLFLAAPSIASFQATFPLVRLHPMQEVVTLLQRLQLRQRQTILLQGRLVALDANAIQGGSHSITTNSNRGSKSSNSSSNRKAAAAIEGISFGLMDLNGRVGTTVNVPTEGMNSQTVLDAIFHLLPSELVNKSQEAGIRKGTNLGGQLQRLCQAVSSQTLAFVVELNRPTAESVTNELLAIFTL
jgi:hypothetical protein